VEGCWRRVGPLAGSPAMRGRAADRARSRRGVGRMRREGSGGVRAGAGRGSGRVRN
jgi:hypothetical protein